MMDVGTAVSNNLRAIREGKKLSLDQAARLTGVSKSMLGQIERGEVNPTITVLWKIANGLKISFTSMIEQPGQTLEIIRGHEIIPLQEDDGRYINYPVFPFEENRGFETYRIEIKPQGCLAAQSHMPGTEEFITVFQGRLSLTVNGQEFELEEKDSIRFRADVPHSYRNDGEGLTELSMVIYYGK